MTTQQIHAPGPFALLLSLIALLVLAGWPTHSAAQGLRMQSNATMGCMFSFSGEIRTGDAAQFATAVSQQRADLDRLMAPIGDRQTRICLDSVGGNFGEAVQIARLIRGVFGTAVPSGATCESSCAVIFMAGSRNPEADPRGIVTDRVLHPNGRLGFHRLRLDVPDGVYTETIVRSAFETALNGLAGLVALSGEIDFPESLIAVMLGTPSDEMRYIETVGEAARWRIAVAPTPRPNRLAPLAVLQACHNHFDYLADMRGTAIYSPYLTWRTSLFFKPVVQTQPRLQATLDGFGQEAASQCTIDEDRSEFPTGPWGWVSIGESLGAATSSSELYAFQFYSRDTPLSALAGSNAARVEALSQRNKGWSVDHSGRCYVFSNGRKLEDEPCTAQSTATISDDLDNAREVHRFTWPSGSATVVEMHDARQWRLNGTDTDYRHISQLPDAVARELRQTGDQMGGQGYLVNCFPNPATGNEFCYLGHAPMGSPFRFDAWRSSLQLLE